MKLNVKISMACILILLSITGICSAILLFRSLDTILQITKSNAVSRHETLCKSFTEMIGYYGSEDIPDIAKRSLAIYWFANFADEECVLVEGDEILYSVTDLEPQEEMHLSEEYAFGAEAQTLLLRREGRNILVVGNTVMSFSKPYKIYIVKDVSDLYNNIRRMVFQFGLVSLFCIGVGIVMVMIFVIRSLQPLKDLSSAAGDIAGGEYGKRVRISTKDEVGELALDFNRMAQAVEVHVEKLQESMERQQLLIGGLTHEFKTPLTSIIGHSETLLSTKQNEQVTAKSLMSIHTQCNWLEKLTQKMMQLIVLQQDISRQEESVPRLLAAVKDSIGETFLLRGIELVISCSAGCLLMDFDFMQSALVNLCDNASKASKPGQQVELRAYENVIQVRDFGCGIPKEEVSRITEPFYMVDRSRNKKKGGIGLGLALVKLIADAHGAQLLIESRLDAGTMVKLIFPTQHKQDE